MSKPDPSGTKRYSPDGEIEVEIVTSTPSPQGCDYACIKRSWVDSFQDYVYDSNMIISEPALNKLFPSSVNPHSSPSASRAGTTLQGTLNTSIQNNVQLSQLSTDLNVGDVLYSHSGHVQLVLVKYVLDKNNLDAWECLLNIKSGNTYTFSNNATVKESVLNKYYTRTVPNHDMLTTEDEVNSEVVSSNSYVPVNPIHYNDVPTTDEELTRALEITRLLSKGY